MTPAPDVPLIPGPRALAARLDRLAMEATRAQFAARRLGHFLGQHPVLELAHDDLRRAACRLVDLAMAVRLGDVPILDRGAADGAPAAYPLLEGIADGREVADAPGAGDCRHGGIPGDGGIADGVEGPDLAAPPDRPDLAGAEALDGPAAAPAAPEPGDDVPGPGVPPRGRPRLTAWAVHHDDGAADGGPVLGRVRGRDASAAGAAAYRQFGHAPGVDPARLRVRPAAADAEPKRARKVAPMKNQGVACES
jgi:hypothetical protein